MEEDRSIDLKQHTLPKVSKWYLVRIVFYVVMLTIIALVWYFTSNKAQVIKEGAGTKEIRGVEIELE